MKNRRNYYRILHVQPDAPRAIIKASYRTLMQKLKLHPDLGGDEWNASILNEAYATLSNNARRAAYDELVLHRIKHAPATENSRQQTENSNKNNTARKSAHYWKDQSVCPFCGTPKPARSDYNSSTLECSQCNSPLKTVVTLEISGKSKRKLKRILHDAQISIYTSPGNTTAIAGVIRNLTPEGMQLLTGEKLEDGLVIRIASEVLSATARVCYCTEENRPGHYAIGIKFLTLQFHDQLGTFFSGCA